MPTPLETTPCGPSLALHLHEVFTKFQGVLLTDIKESVQAVVQDALDKHAGTQEQMLEKIAQELRVAVSPQHSKEPATDDNGGDKTSIVLPEEEKKELLSSMAPMAFTNQASDMQPKSTSLRATCSVKIGRRSTVGAAGSSSAIKLFGNVERWLGDGRAIDQQEYSVYDYYVEAGIRRDIATSDIFNNGTLLVICLNAIFMGIDADWNGVVDNPGDDGYFFACEQLFCVFFTAELLVRFFAFAETRYCLRDRWFMFDSFLVFLMVGETWVTPLILLAVGDDPLRKDSNKSGGVLRLLRLLRLARISRLMRSFPELATMVKGMMAATRAVGSAIMMLLLLIYVFAILMHSLLRSNAAFDFYFSNIRSSMLALLLDGVLGDDTGKLLRILVDEEEVIALTFFGMFIMLTSITVMNMLIGVLCEVVTEVAECEKEVAAKHQMKSTLLVELKRIDEDGTGHISKEEFQSILADPGAVAILQDIDVDIYQLSDVMEMLYERDGELTIAGIMHVMLSFRKDRPLTVEDMFLSLNYVVWRFTSELKKVESSVLHSITKCR